MRIIINYDLHRIACGPRLSRVEHFHVELTDMGGTALSVECVTQKAASKKRAMHKLGHFFFILKLSNGREECG